MTPRRAYVIVAVLIVVVVLSLAAYTFTNAMSAERRAAVRTHEATAARLAAVSGVHYVAAALADRGLVRLWPTMFAYQFVYELDVIPALDEPLDVATDQPG